MKPFRIMSALALLAFSLAGLAQEQQSRIPIYVHPRPSFDDAAFAPSSTPLQTWNGTFTYEGHTNNFVMVGTDPSKTNVTTSISVLIIPIKLGIKGSSGVTYFDPLTKQSNGNTAVQNIVNSPLFQNQDYNQGGVDVGNTQYEDAFQRANFWSDVMTNSDYHVVFNKPTVLPEYTFVIPSQYGSIGNDFGVQVAQVDYNWFISQVPAELAKLKQVQPNVLPIIIAYNTYWTSGPYIVGGWHDAYGNSNSPQTYSVSTYIDATSAFASDISALSHELGEWMDDPYVDNTQGACGGILEVGDPLENETAPHLYGDYLYTLNNYTYHVQDLVLLKYFGQTPATSVNSYWTFQGQADVTGEGEIGVCSFGQ